MPEAAGARFGLQAIAGTDHIDDLDTIDQAQCAILEAKGAVFAHGTLGARPTSSGGTPGITGRLYLATDQTPQQLFYDTGAGWLQLMASGAPSGGSCVVAGAETRSSASFGTLTTPDEVAGIVLPTNGLIAVWYQATWQSSVSGAGRANIFIGANELQAIASNTSIGPSAAGAEAATLSTGVLSLASTANGLRSGAQATNYTGDVTTGQTISPGPPSSTAPIGGPSWIFAAAGTYTVSVQFAATSGSVTASARRLVVRVF